MSGPKSLPLIHSFDKYLLDASDAYLVPDIVLSTGDTDKNPCRTDYIPSGGKTRISKTVDDTAFYKCFVQKQTTLGE